MDGFLMDVVHDRSGGNFQVDVDRWTCRIWTGF